jgi:hypothetical protein
MDFTGHSISGTTTIDYPALTHAAHWITRERNPADGFFKPAANQVVMKSAAIKPSLRTAFCHGASLCHAADPIASHNGAPARVPLTPARKT